MKTSALGQVTAVLRHIGLATFVILTIACIRQWRAHNAPAIRWATTAFGSLAAIGLIGLGLQQKVFLGVAFWLIKGLVAVLILFPYFLYRFAISFKRPGRAVILTVRLVTLAAVVYTLALPRFVLPGMPRPVWVEVFRALIFVQWTLLFCIIALQLWGGSKTETTVPRRRMRTLALATIGMNLSVIVSSVAPAPQSELMTLLTQILSLGSSCLFFVGLAPPAWLIHVWRLPEQIGFQSTMHDLFAAKTQAEVSRIILPHAVRIIGGRGAALVSSSGAILATHGETDSPEEIAGLAMMAHMPEQGRIQRVRFRTGSMLVWTSPYAPFFSQSELSMLDGWGMFIDLAFERTKAAEQQRTFIANAAHELRTPLTTILGLSTTLAQGSRNLSAKQVQDCVEALERQGTRAVTLIRNLLDLAQLDGGRLVTSIAPVSLLSAAQSALEAAPPPEGTTVTIAIPPHAVAAADPDRLEQILVNLLLNAYRHGGREVRIDTRDEPDGIVLVVSDVGPGVPEELVPHLFEPFARAVGLKSPGSGLGLALSKRLAEAIAGSMWYAPASPHGARFNVRLRKSA
jgi:signal transduction histidine kinase